jgi:very-short-patch-repair endonuclease/transcription elongation GreA/GreB family factor
MFTQQKRLFSLIEFAQQSALMRSNPVGDVAKHGIFHEFENSLLGLPSIHLDDSTPLGGDIWLTIERLQESRAPKPESILFETWLEISNHPSKEPILRTHVEAQALAVIGALPITPKDKADVTIEKLVALDSFTHRKDVESHFKSYLENVWKPWAEEEKRRRKTISLYAKLYTLKQQLEGGIVDSQLELVWGAGMAVWDMAGTRVAYPIITQLAELSLNESTMAIEIRPRDVEPRVEIDIYSAADNPGVQNLEKTAKEFFSNATQTFSPFDRGSFEPLLCSAVTHLDSKGVYWPSQITAEDRLLPKVSDELKITDTWVIFARPRSASLFIQDLEHFKKQFDKDGAELILPKAAAALVTDPATQNEDILLPAFRGLSMVCGSGGSAASGKRAPQDLYFPMPFNDEQVRIVQMLECSDGVVVQGPPGTGKTHTIANIICHYLALGKRVLVTSMRDPALAVLQEKLPGEIRPLAISLLTSEQDGMKQFEFAVSKIASEVQRIDRVAYSRDISQLEGMIDAYHGKLAYIDSQIGEWALKNLSRIKLEDETLEPQDAAEEVAKKGNEINWFDDEISIVPEHQPLFTDQEIFQLRDTRRALSKDIDYLGCEFPSVAAFPDSHELLRVHQDLSRLAELQAQADTGGVPLLAESSKEIYEAAQSLASQISNLRLLRQSIDSAEVPWARTIRERLRQGGNGEVLGLLEALGRELEAALAERKWFLSKPVTVPSDIDLDMELMEALENLSQGKRPFGLAGLLGKGEAKKALGTIRVINSEPAGIEDWAHVKSFVLHLKRLRELVTRWNALAPELQIPAMPANDPAYALTAGEAFTLFQKVRKSVELEKAVASQVQKILPTWRQAQNVAADESCLDEAERILLHHLMRNRLAATWAMKERLQQVLSDCSGRITENIRVFLEGTLGNPAISDAEMQGQWSALMEELRRVHGLRHHLEVVAKTCTAIETSGAPKWATRLRTEPVSTTVDILLPDNWREAWRLRRLTTYLNSIDSREELRRLTKQRTEMESGLARAYQDVVTKRTWLKLAENATPSIRSALMAYTSAIAKIGKGTGKRAVRYRQDARAAATQANPAIPCWIMPHYRISESLPPEFGCFDLVVIDEASQSDLTALPAILRAQKVLVVGDDKQVSPEGVGLEEGKIRSLMTRFLTNQVETYRPQMSPERSIYDLFKVVFAKSAVMLKEHFRCVAPIIEYSKREFYNHELQSLRLPKTSERLDPPLVDVFVEDGFRNKGDVNQAEAQFIVDEIKAIVQDPRMEKRTIGVVSLLADKQALKIWAMLEDEVGLDLIQRHKIACGDARTFQGKERDIMFLSTVVSRGNATAISRDTFAQRFNVAASRARDRMYLVRSVGAEDLSEKDYLRRGLVAHFSTPFAQDEPRVADLRELCESPFELAVYDLLTERGFRVTPQVPVGSFRLDMVVEGHQDNRLAVECDGDRYHGPDRWADDMNRQRILERAGWRFWRCFASTFVMQRSEVIQDLLRTLEEKGIEPIGAANATPSVYVERRRYSTFHSNEVKPAEDFQLEDVDREKDSAHPKPDEIIASQPHSATDAFLHHGKSEEREEAATAEGAFIQSANIPQKTYNNEIEVEVEDTVIFAPLEKPEEEKAVRITQLTTDLSQGFLAYTAPLAQVFLGGVVGDEVILRIPGQLPKKLIIKKILRPGISAV